MDMKPIHIERAGPLADVLLQELSELPPGTAEAALAMALGYLAEQRGVSLSSVMGIVEAAYTATRMEAA